VTRKSGATHVGRGQDRLERARACPLAGQAGAAPAADYAHDRPRLDESSRRAIESTDRPHAPSADSGPAGWPRIADARETASHALWLAPCQAPEGGADVTGLVRMTGWMRTRLDLHQRQYADAGRAIGVSGGRWRARRPGGRSL
jgi:hypothetical protein